MEKLYKKQAIYFIYKTKSFKIKKNPLNLRIKHIEIPFTNTQEVANTNTQLGLRFLEIIPN